MKRGVVSIISYSSSILKKRSTRKLFSVQFFLKNTSQKRFNSSLLVKRFSTITMRRQNEETVSSNPFYCVKSVDGKQAIVRMKSESKAELRICDGVAI